MPNDDDKPELLANNTPKSMVMPKKRAKKLNNLPLVFASVVVVILLTTLGNVVVTRNQSSTDDSQDLVGQPATALAKDLMRMEAGVVPPKKLDPPPLPQPATTEPQDARAVAQAPSIPSMAQHQAMPALGKKPEMPVVNEEARRMREIRLREAEEAIYGPIKVQLDEIKTNRLEDELSIIEKQIATLSNRGSLTYEDQLALVQARTERNSANANVSSQNDLSRLNQFTAKTEWFNEARVEAPPTKYILRTGTVIPAVLESEIISDLPGQIKARVSQDVYDSPIGRDLLIPQNSTLIGEYSSDVMYGQSILFTVWKRIIFPDGKALDLGAMPGTAGSGSAGFKDRVNNHYVRIFGSALMMSAIMAGVDMTQNNKGYDNGSNRQRMADALSESLGQQLGGVMAEMISRNMSIAPTIEIRRGYLCNVMVTKDILFDGPYRPFDWAK